MSREFHSHQPDNVYSPGEQNNSNETVSENYDVDSDSVKSIRSDNSDPDHEKKGVPDPLLSRGAP